jgi:hypothetical protein
LGYVGRLLAADLTFGERLLLMGRCRDVSLTGAACASGLAALALLIAGEHLFLIRGRG